VGLLEAFDFNVERHPVMGAPTLNVGTLHGGLNINSVPDRAEIGIDIRTIPGMRHGLLRDQIASYLSPEVELIRIWIAKDEVGRTCVLLVFSFCDRARGVAFRAEESDQIADAFAHQGGSGRALTSLGQLRRVLAHSSPK
jgi:acetylornithine deacetylase/succinyl-diaminopimelate desuccinylase-like protein